MDTNSKEQPTLNKEEIVDSVLKTVQQPRDDMLSEKEGILQQMMMLTAQIQNCTNVSALHAAKTHISFASRVIKVLSCESGPTYTSKSKEPSNKNVVPQQRFHSTRKRSRSANVRLTKPSPDEKEVIYNSLLEKKQLYPIEELNPKDRTSILSKYVRSAYVFFAVSIVHEHLNVNICRNSTSVDMQGSCGSESSGRQRTSLLE